MHSMTTESRNRRENVTVRLSQPARDYLELLADELGRRSFRGRSLGATVEYALMKLEPPKGAGDTLATAHDALVATMKGLDG